MARLLIVALVGFAAQLIDGSLGMAYGVTSSTLLLTVGLAPASASASVHLAEIGTTLVSGASHWRLGNVDWRTVALMAVPGAVAAFLGATFLASLDADAATPWVALLLLGLGAFVVWRFLFRGGTRPTTSRPLRARFLAPLAVVAGTMDAIGGGGWGPVGTTSLLSSGRLEPRKVVGSIDTSEFLVAVGGSLGFLLALGHAGIDLTIVLALLGGGVVAAPIAAHLVRILPARVLAVAAGSLILLTNARTILASFGVATPVLTGILLTLLALGVLAVRKAVRDERSARAPENETLGECASPPSPTTRCEPSSSSPAAAVRSTATPNR